ncbi:helix-turn-helix domain-containing protein [Kitasatospora sp. NPDC093806]|uniref:helix-turn-helix transcriptional regulator n=1 Tax=Kitasatospora sp. NPDC093806 TaxID=3155075 RepID=UPI00343FF153
MTSKRARLAERRVVLGYSQEQLAEATGVSVSTVVRWEAGRATPQPYQRPRLARILQVTLAELAGILTLEMAAGSAASAPTALLPDDVDAPEDDVDRRTFAIGTAAIVASTASEPWERLTAVLGGSRADSVSTMALLGATASMFSAEEHTPARLLASQLGEHLNAITTMLPASGAHQQALTIAAGETAALAGWTYWDLGDYRRAQQYYRTARQAADISGHGPLHALVLGYASYGVGSTRARHMLAAAQGYVRGRGHAAARSWLAAREAEECAANGDREGAVRALDRAETAFDYADPATRPAWMSFFGRARLGSMQVAAYAQLRHEGLGAAADQTLADLGEDDRKVRVAILGDVAAGYLAAGAVDQAVDVGRRALAATLESETTMGTVRLSALAGRLPETAAARHLREEIRAALG